MSSAVAASSTSKQQQQSQQQQSQPRKSTRGWEVTKKASTPSVATSTSSAASAGKVNKALTFHDTTTAAEKELHRNTFLYFLQSLIGQDVEVLLADGRKFKGIFFTATPFVNTAFRVVLKFVTRSVFSILLWTIC